MRSQRSYKTRLPALAFELLLLTISATQEGSQAAPLLFIPTKTFFALFLLFISRVSFHWFNIVVGVGVEKLSGIEALRATERRNDHHLRKSDTGRNVAPLRVNEGTEDEKTVLQREETANGEIGAPARRKYGERRTATRHEDGPLDLLTEGETSPKNGIFFHNQP